VALVTQSKGNNSGAADWRLDGAWGSLPGKSAARNFFGPIFSRGFPQMNAFSVYPRKSAA